MAEHFDTDQFAFRTAYVLLLYVTIDAGHLVHIQLACQDDNVGVLGIELQRLGVGYIELGREVYLYALAVGIL